MTQQALQFAILRAKSKKKITGGDTPSPHPTPFGASILALTVLDLGALSTLLAVYTRDQNKFILVTGSLYNQHCSS